MCIGRCDGRHDGKVSADDILSRVKLQLFGTVR